MSFISKNLRVFHARISEDEYGFELGGKLRDFENEMDPRSWSMSCFERHDYLLELLLRKRSQPIKKDVSVQLSTVFNSGSGDVELRGAGLTNSSLAGSFIKEDSIAVRSQKSFLDCECNKTRNSIGNSVCSVNVSRGDGLETCVRITRAYGKEDIMIRRLESKLMNALTENALLHRELEKVKRSKTSYIEKIQIDLNRYLQVCAKQKESINSLKLELEFMHEELNKLYQEDSRWSRHPYRVKCDCGT